MVQLLFTPKKSVNRQYVNFIDEAKSFVDGKGIAWDVDYDSSGQPNEGTDWDIRQLVNSHARYASMFGSIAVDKVVRDLAEQADWAVATLPDGPRLEKEAVDFIKAIVVFRCMDGRLAKSSRHIARVLKRFFSVTTKHPSELQSEDFRRFQELGMKDSKAFNALTAMANLMNQRLLSDACPILLECKDVKGWDALKTNLASRSNEEKLPDRHALLELARIVFHEQPKNSEDLLRFCIVKILLLTGLRINEVLMLPQDCLRWEDHVDIVTGLPAGEVGGMSRSLRLRYFAEKRSEGAPDLLVEDHQWVPRPFQSIIEGAVELARSCSALARQQIIAEHGGMTPCGSDLRRFKTSAGILINTSDLLFLCSGKRKAGVSLPATRPVKLISQNSVYGALGCAKRWNSSFFSRYGSENTDKDKIRPHSLRHLINTELFRLNVTDAVITQQFGRKSVVESHKYDRQSLSEQLEHVRLPDVASNFFKKGSTQELVAKLVVGGLSPKSHIAMSFKAIQVESGDEAAFTYLAANSDGFHVTPYGFCLNSFSVNPCARHLKCFDKCKHFTASGLPEHLTTLESLRLQLTVMRDAATARPAVSAGRRNQIAHADALLSGVEAAILAQPGSSVFGGSIDHSVSAGDILS